MWPAAVSASVSESRFLPTCGRPRTSSTDGSSRAAMYASTACESASMPECAVTTGGAPIDSSGSQIAWRGIRCGLATPIFISVAGSVMTETGVASEPVPAVVGSAISGTTGPGTDWTA